MGNKKNIKRNDIPCGIYEHYKGGKYRVLGVAKHSETLEDLVIYERVDGEGDLWVRPLQMFLEEVEVEGEKVRRFRCEEVKE